MEAQEFAEEKHVFDKIMTWKCLLWNGIPLSACAFSSCNVIYLAKEGDIYSLDF